MFWLLSIIFLSTHLMADASPPCFRELEDSFYNRIVVTEALAFVQIQQGLWEYIIRDLNTKTPFFHSEVLKLAAKAKKNPTNHPFQMAKAKQILEHVLFKNLQETMRNYKYVLVREEDITSVYQFIKARHRMSWDACR